jgi:hypothetical protein
MLDDLIPNVITREPTPLHFAGACLAKYTTYCAVSDRLNNLPQSGLCLFVPHASEKNILTSKQNSNTKEKRFRIVTDKKIYDAQRLGTSVAYA